MTTRLVLAPAGHGKTAHAIERIQHTRADDPLAAIWVILPDQAQVRAFRCRLATQPSNQPTVIPSLSRDNQPKGRPGALSVHLGTFYTFYGEILARAGRPAPRLLEPVQHRVLRHVVDRLCDEGALVHYAPLRDKPGFVRVLRQLIQELKRARVRRDPFIAAVAAAGPRLKELAALYAAYQDWLLQSDWTDAEGQGWLAAIEMENDPTLAAELRLLVVDGFDEFDPTQLAVLRLLADRAAETLITLTGDLGHPTRLAHRRFARAQAAIVQTLNVQPVRQYPISNIQYPIPTFIEAQNRAEEVRAALRWLKARIVLDSIAPGEAALIARDLPPYRPFVEEIAAEFGLPVYVASGADLSTNPAVAALLSLLSLPVTHWPHRAVLDAWRSPYFEWQTAISNPQSLDSVARAGQVIEGLEQWREALDRLAAAAPQDEASSERADDLAPARPPQGQEAVALRRAFDAFVEQITPPSQASVRDYVTWVEDLIGDDPKLTPNPPPKGRTNLQSPPSLHIVANAWAAEEQPGGRAAAERDVAALQALKDVLRGLVLAASVLEQTHPIPYARFFNELRATVESATYRSPAPAHEAILVAPVLVARGLSFRAVALLGLAEGEFPQPEREDPLLRESDRHTLREQGLMIDPRLRGDEATFFYEAVTRARDKLLLTRPYLADDGQPWEPSPYWEQVLHLFQADVRRTRPEAPLVPSDAASPGEWLIVGATHPDVAVQLSQEEAWTAVQHGAAVLQARSSPAPAGPYEGDLSALAPRLSAKYGPRHVWSSSRLEAYAACPYHFFVGQSLALEPRTPPQAGFDVFILGNLYHEILEKVYQRSPADPLAALPAVAAEVFDAAPTTYGFRPTPLWDYQQRELTQVLERTLVALLEASQGYQPYAQEQAFGLRDQPPLVIRGQGGDVLQVRGFIDRVDRATGSGELRIMDYKSGSTPIPARDLAEGKRVQLPLYALAARDALGLGDVDGGFYWHVGSGKPSSFRLEKAGGGVQGAIDTAVTHAWATVRGVRAGAFPPDPPAKGCPGHCPAVAFCWRYVGRGW